MALATLVATVLALWISWVSAGEGHGNFVWARILLPYSCACMAVPGLHFLVIPFALLQYPVYGFLIQLAKKSGQLMGIGSITLALHIVVVTLTFTLLREGFR